MGGDDGSGGDAADVGGAGDGGGVDIDFEESGAEYTKRSVDRNPEIGPQDKPGGAVGLNR